MKFATLDDQEEFSLETPMIRFYRLLYFVNVTIGNPPVQQYLEVDTGSSLTWVRGGTYPPRRDDYVPSKSYSFRQMSCGDPICTSKNTFQCLTQKINQCGYKIYYADGTESAGRIGYDQFGFVNYEEPRSHSFVDNVVFGYLGNITNGTPSTKDKNFNGILGLGPRSISLVNQLPGPKLFSYCVSNLSSADASEGYIHFGEANDYTGDLQTTPIIQGYPQYIIEIQSICLGNVCLPIDPSVFKHIPGVKSGVSIDTGAIYSFLPDIAYAAVEDAVIKMMKSKNKTYVPGLYKNNSMLCYDGKLDDDESSYPSLIINFAGGGGATMEITRNVYLHELRSGLHCLSFRRSSRFGGRYKKYTVLGLLSQQYHVFEFNLDSWSVGILGDKFCNDPIL
ncbi:aspartic proteinase PCS1 [Daucus carota subsp. sativus]|nr:PREDICTED: aspartic proteinase PCS1-like [Daucus carota subsp. sativus]